MRNVVVIGAGPAGCTAALVLARAGVEVALIEQHRFPRDKVCGECLSALAIAALEKLGLSSGLRELGPARMTHAAIHSSRGSEYRLALPAPMWGISRRTLDQFLLKQAIAAGVKVLQPARCEAIEAKPLEVRVRDLESNEICTLEPDQIILAEGKGALLPITPTHTGDFGVKAHFENIDGPAHTIDVFGGTGVYGGLSQIEGGQWNTAFSVPAARLRAHGGNLESLFDEIRTENPGLNRRFEGARRMSDWLAAPVPRFSPRNHWPAGVIPVGNAAAALEPICGEGMGLAMCSAHLAARFVWERPDGNVWEVLNEYQRLWRGRGVCCRLAARVVSSPLASRVLLPALNVVPVTSLMRMSLLGKNHLNPSMSDMA